MILLCILCLCLAAVFLWQEKEAHYVLAAALKGLENGCWTGERVMYICRTPEEYVKRLLDMAEKRTAGSTFSEYETVGRAAREYIRRYYTWEKYGEAYLKGIEGER